MSTMTVHNRALPFPTLAAAIAGMTMRTMTVHNQASNVLGGACQGESFSFRAGVAQFTRNSLETVRTWQRRSDARARLLELDDRLLADIGINRADALLEARKPFWKA